VTVDLPCVAVDLPYLCLKQLMVGHVDHAACNQWLLHINKRAQQQLQQEQTQGSHHGPAARRGSNCFCLLPDAAAAAAAASGEDSTVCSKHRTTVLQERSGIRQPFVPAALAAPTFHSCCTDVRDNAFVHSARRRCRQLELQFLSAPTEYRLPACLPVVVLARCHLPGDLVA